MNTRTSGQPVPVTIITGYLGSGKTTLLNALLAGDHGLRVAVIQNEFGEIAVDNDLVLGLEEEMITLANGCACCTARGDIIDAVEQLLDGPARFDRIVIETSGVATPGPVVMTLATHDDAGDRFVLDGVVALADGANVARQLQHAPEAADQLAYADVIVLNKRDLVSADELHAAEASIRAINPSAPIERTAYARIAPELALEVGGFDHRRVEELLGGAETAGMPAVRHERGVRSVAIGSGLGVNTARFEEWMEMLLQTHHGNIYRVKGVLNVAEHPRRYVVQAVHGLWSRQFGGMWGSAVRGSRIVVIGRELDERSLRDGFGACLE
ncbi:MAG TPA: GTP-binding protein [Candidatus Kapabacteria bacterium]|nr:GTP-binding protein [Candidatus Kapabacteria bacterium]